MDLPGPLSGRDEKAAPKKLNSFPSGEKALLPGLVDGLQRRSELFFKRLQCFLHPAKEFLKQRIVGNRATDSIEQPLVKEEEVLILHRVDLPFHVRQGSFRCVAF